MKFYKSILASTLLLTMSQGAFAHSNYSDELILQKTENLKLSTDKINDFVIEAGSGKLKVIASDVDSIEVVAEIYQRKAHNDYCLDLKKIGNKAKLESASCNHNRDTRIDLTIEVPENLNLDVEDGSGSINIAGVASLKLKDGSGSINIRNVNGKVEIDDGSGSIDIKHVENDVSIDDGSGSIHVRNVSGKVTVSDGSGSINVNKADSFELLSDGSGSVNVDNIAGKVIMDD